MHQVVAVVVAVVRDVAKLNEVLTVGRRDERQDRIVPDERGVIHRGEFEASLVENRDVGIEEVVAAAGARAEAEADDLARIVDLMRHLRGSETRRHVREEVPFYTGARVGIADLVDRLP